MRSLVNRAQKVAYSFAFMLAIASARPAFADTVTVMWDQSPDSGVSGYLVYVGTASAVYATTYDVGNTTSFTFPSATPGQQYYFAVASYKPGPVIGPKSTEVTTITNAAPTLSNPGSQTTIVNQSTSLQLSATDPQGQPLTFGATSLPPGVSVSSSTGRISGTPTALGSYVVTAIATDGVLSDSETFTWTVIANPTDVSSPQLTITVPTTQNTYQTDQSVVLLGGTATDDRIVTEVTWTTDRGNSGRATGTDSWLAGIPLQRGPNMVTVHARDAAGNVSSRAIVVKLSGKNQK